MLTYHGSHKLKIFHENVVFFLGGGGGGGRRGLMFCECTKEQNFNFFDHCAIKFFVFKFAIVQYPQCALACKPIQA